MKEDIFERPLFEFIATYPLSNEESPENPFAIGLVLSFFSFLIFPVFILYGYSLDLTKSVYKEKEAPKYSDEVSGYMKYLKEGFIVTLVLPLPLILLNSSLIIMYIESGSDFLGALFISTSLISIYSFPSIYVLYAVERSISAAFSVDSIYNIITNIEYVKGWFLYIGIGTIIWIVLLFFSFITFGLISFVSLPLTVYPLSALWGLIYKRVRD